MKKSTTGERMQAVARGASAAAVGAKNAVSEFVTGPMPEVKLYTEPLNPSTQITIGDRVELVLASCRPWSEFFDLSAFNTPPASEVKIRIGANVETFFYNYLVVAFVDLAINAIFHLLRAFLLALTVVSAVLLYIIFPEDYVISENFTVTKYIKHIIMAILTLLVFTVGNVFSLLLLVVCTFIPLAIIHAFLREHAAQMPSSI